MRGHGEAHPEPAPRAPCAPGASGGELGALREVQASCAAHFVHEEALMKQHGFGGGEGALSAFTSHTNDHARMLADLQAAISAGEALGAHAPFPHRSRRRRRPLVPTARSGQPPLPAADPSPRRRVARRHAARRAASGGVRAPR